ncbi:MAG: ATPase [Cyanothece sp. SIO1E1]|nr:ATPase [Cyanothece sp. SIO1E1]
MEKQLGQTKEVGFQFGLRKTFPISSEEMWDFIFSEKGVGIWLGKLKTEFELQKHFETESGITGFVRVINPYSHIRINWKKKGWNNLSTLQIRVISKQEKSTLSIHQEKLLDFEQRAVMKEYWNATMSKITSELNKASS